MYYLNLPQVNKYLLTVNNEKWWINAVKRSEVLVVEFESLCPWQGLQLSPSSDPSPSPIFFLVNNSSGFNIPLPLLQPGRPFD